MMDEDARLERTITEMVAVYMANGEGAGATLAALTEDVMQAMERKRQNTEFMLLSLQKSAAPCLALKFLQWVLSQSDKFYDDPAGLWHLLQCELGLTTEQMAQFAALRIRPTAPSPVPLATAPLTATNAAAAAASSSATPCSLSSSSLDQLLFTVAGTVRSQLSSGQHQLHTLQRLLSPAQLARFFKWVHTFGHVCVKINTH